MRSFGIYLGTEERRRETAVVIQVWFCDRHMVNVSIGKNSPLTEWIFFLTVCCAHRDDRGSLASPNKVMIDSVVLVLDWHDKTQPNKKQQPPQKPTDNQTPTKTEHPMIETTVIRET